MEEDTTPPRRNDTLLLGGMRATRSSSMRFTEPQGRTEEPSIPPRRSTRSSAPPPYTPRYSEYGFIIMTGEEEEKIARLEKRLVANVDFDDQALNLLGFDMDIYYMLGHLGWVQFSNGVLVNTHKEFTLEIFMTMAPILDEGVSSLSFRLEGIQQVVPYEYIRELLGFQKGALEVVDVPEGMLDGFWNMIAGGAHRQRNIIRNPIIQVFHSWMCKRILGRMRETKVTDMELNWLYSALIARQPIDPSHLMINRWCCEATSGSGDIGSGYYLSMLAISLRLGITRNPEHLLPVTSL
jgi:hypothetical protein